MTKDIENINKKWDAKILGMMKAYEKDKRFRKTEEQRIPFRQTSPLPNIAVNDANENLKELQTTKVLQTRYVTLENKLVMSKQLDKIQN